MTSGKGFRMLAGSHRARHRNGGVHGISNRDDEGEPAQIVHSQLANSDQKIKG